MNNEDKTLEEIEAQIEAEVWHELQQAIDESIIIEILKNSGEFLYVFLDPQKYDSTTIIEWVEKNCIDYRIWVKSGDFLFKREQDMVLFKLTWE